MVDDSIEITELIKEVASEDGYEVFTLNKSTLFFERMREVDPDLLCIDIHMPDVDGIEILRGLADKGCRAGVIILSGGDPLFTKVAERIGVASKMHVQTLEKPFRLDIFRAALRAHEDYVAGQGSAASVC